MALAAEHHAYHASCGALHSVAVCRHERSSESFVVSCGSGGCWQLGAGLSQCDRFVPDMVESMPALPVAALSCGMFHTLCLVSAPNLAPPPLVVCFAQQLWRCVQRGTWTRSCHTPTQASLIS